MRLSTHLSVETCDSAEPLISVLILLLPSEEDKKDLLLDPGVGVAVLGCLLETVYELRGGVERLVEGRRVLRERLEESESSKLTVGGGILDLLADGSRGFVGTGGLDVALGEKKDQAGCQRREKREPSGWAGVKALTLPGRALRLRQVRSLRSCHR